MATWSRGGPALGTALALALTFASHGPAEAHAQGFHKKLLLTAFRSRLEGLVTLNVDGAERVRGLRAAADVDGDRRLSQPELQELQKRVALLAVGSLKLSISGAPLPVSPGLIKLDLKGDFGVTDTGLSVAVMLLVRHPSPVTPGMTLLVQDKSPDLSPVAVEVYQVRSPDAGFADRFELHERQLEPGQAFPVRLGLLAD